MYHGMLAANNGINKLFAISICMFSLVLGNYLIQVSIFDCTTAPYCHQEDGSCILMYKTYGHNTRALLASIHNKKIPA